MKITPIHDYPQVSKALLDSIKEQFPKVEYTWETHTREIDYNQGIQSVILFLERIYQHQTTPKRK